MKICSSEKIASSTPQPPSPPPPPPPPPPQQQLLRRRRFLSPPLEWMGNCGTREESAVVSNAQGLRSRPLNFIINYSHQFNFTVLTRALVLTHSHCLCFWLLQLFSSFTMRRRWARVRGARMQVARRSTVTVTVTGTIWASALRIWASPVPHRTVTIATTRCSTRTWSPSRSTSWRP